VNTEDNGLMDTYSTPADGW